MPNLIDLLIRLSQIRGGHCFVDFSIFERDEGKGCNFENKMYCKATREEKILQSQVPILII